MNSLDLKLLSDLSDSAAHVMRFVEGVSLMKFHQTGGGGVRLGSQLLQFQSLVCRQLCTRMLTSSFFGGLT